MRVKSCFTVAHCNSGASCPCDVGGGNSAVWGSAYLVRASLNVIAQSKCKAPLEPLQRPVRLSSPTLHCCHHTSSMGTFSSRPATEAARKFAENAIATNSKQHSLLHSGWHVRVSWVT